MIELWPSPKVSKEVLETLGEEKLQWVSSRKIKVLEETTGNGKEKCYL